MPDKITYKLFGKICAAKPKLLHLFLLCFFSVFNPVITTSGPPYDTDDPVPVDLRCWELYFSSHSNYNRILAQGTLPHFEINYGALKNVQLHLIVPLAFYSEYGGAYNYGIGDIEAGVKYRFIRETEYIPQIGIFPLIEIPTGNSSKELGNGKAQYLLPVWIQKSFGDKWQTYGGYGYWINPGKGNKNWSYIGWQVQYQLSKKASIGAEICYSTPDTEEGKSDTRFNIGSVIDINSQNHILISAGRSFNDNTLFQCYIGYLFTIPGKVPSNKNPNFHQANN